MLSSSGLQEIADSSDYHQLDPHNSQCLQHSHPHHFLSVSASCLVSTSTTNSSDEEEDEEVDEHEIESEMCETRQTETTETGEGVTELTNVSPCRLMRRAAMIRRRRVRRLTEGSISPSVFLTSPATNLHSHHGSEWMSLSSETVVLGSGLLGQQKNQSAGASSGDERGGLLIMQNSTRLSPPCSLSSHSSESG